MRRIVAVSLALALLFTVAGCLINRYSSDPNQRLAQLQAGGRSSDPGPLPQPAAPPSRLATDGLSATAGPGTADPLELRQALAEKKARLHETQAQFYKLEAQRYAVQKVLRDLEAQIAADEKGLGEALKEKPTQGAGKPKRKPVPENDRGATPEKARPTAPQGAPTPPLSSRFWRSVDRLQSFLGVRVLNVYSSDPNRRMENLLNNSEDLRQIEQEWERPWLTDQPTHLKPERVSGGIE
jgi:hypothetical protein